MKLKKEFEQFYKDIRIDNEQNTLIQKRTILENEIKDNLPDIMAKHDIELKKSDIRIIDQGSYELYFLTQLLLTLLKPFV